MGRDTTRNSITIGTRRTIAALMGHARPGLLAVLSTNLTVPADTISAQATVTANPSTTTRREPRPVRHASVIKLPDPGDRDGAESAPFDWNGVRGSRGESVTGGRFEFEAGSGSNHLRGTA